MGNETTDSCEIHLPNHKVSHDCEVLLGFSDAIQEINDMAVKLNSSKTNDNLIPVFTSFRSSEVIIPFTQPEDIALDSVIVMAVVPNSSISENQAPPPQC
jgi:hypothetical protein